MKKIQDVTDELSSKLSTQTSQPTQSNSQTSSEAPEAAEVPPFHKGVMAYLCGRMFGVWGSKFTSAYPIGDTLIVSQREYVDNLANLYPEVENDLEGEIRRSNAKEGISRALEIMKSQPSKYPWPNFAEIIEVIKSQRPKAMHQRNDQAFLPKPTCCKESAREAIAKMKAGLIIT